MEVCGGHTHAIYRHGLEELLPPEVELVHGPGCPVCVIPMGRVDDAIAIAEADGVTLATFGDMLRVPGGRGSLLEAKARGADVRMVYSPLDALALAAKLARPARRLLRDRLRDDRAGDRGDAAPGPRRGDAELLRLLQPRPDRAAAAGDPRDARAARRRLHRAGSRLDGDRHRRVSLHPRGVRPARSSSRPSSRSTCCSRSRCCCASAPRDAARSRTSTRASSGPRGTPARWRRSTRRWSCGRTSSGAASARCPAARCACAPRFAAWDAEQLFTLPGARIEDPKACRCGEVLTGQIKPWECGVFGTACTPERPLGTCMVSSEGACAAFYAYGRLRRPRGGAGWRVGGAGCSATSSSPSRTAPAARRPATSSKALFLEELGNDGARAARRQRRRASREPAASR